jgi:phytoene dehydrogenase-like protein
MPGYLFNPHAIYMMMVDYAPVYKDFKLEEEYDVRHIYPPLQFAMPLSDGRCLCLYTDVEKSCQSIAQFSKKDADAYRELYHKCRRHVDEFIAPATYVHPMPALDQVAELMKTNVGKEMMEFSEKSPKEIVDEYFENEHVKAMMLYVGAHWGVNYDQGGLGYLVTLYIDRAVNYRLCIHGSHKAASALHKVISENSGLVLDNVRIKRIVIKDGTAIGVELDDGTIYEADKIISTIDPHQTFLNYVGEENLDKELVLRVKGWQWESYSLLTINLALKEAPNFTAAAANPEINKAFIYLLGFETPDELISYWDAIYSGEFPEKVVYNCCFPAVHDPTQAPPGRCTGIISIHAPYRLKEGVERWLGILYKQEIIRRSMAVMQKYAPNMSMDKILLDLVTTPMDTENRFADMIEGSFKQGAYLPLQMGYLRPNEECSQNRTPIKNLYLGGASCYPGGLVIWGPGYVAANAVAEDLGIAKWWKEPEIVTKAREKGLPV